MQKKAKQKQDDGAAAFRGILDGSETLIDPLSGIPIEEQEEILAQIDGIAEKNRLSLSGGMEAGKKGRFAAKKNGGLFPILVNLIMLVVLVGGFFALSTFQNEASAQAREGARVFSPVERALLAEMRRETDGLLAAADREITRLQSPLADVERQLQELAAAGEAPEQAEELERLMILQGELHAELDMARQERSRILDEARSMEMALQVQRDTRVYGYDSGIVVPDASVGVGADADAAATARAELERLSGEWAQAAAVEAQITAFFANVYRQAGESGIYEVERTVEALREFMDAPAFLAIAPSRRELHAQAVYALEALLGEYRNAHATILAGTAPPDSQGAYVESRLQGEIAELERLLEERDDTIDTLGVEIAGSEQVIAQLQSANVQLQSSVVSLQNTNTTLTTQLNTLRGNLSQQAHLDETARQEADILQYYIQTLRAENVTLNQAVSYLQTQNEGLNHQLTQIRAAVQRMSQ